ARAGADEPRGADLTRREMNAVERATDDGEGAAGHTAAARFLARMGRIDERHARAARREQVCRPRAGGSGADNRDVFFHSSRGPGPARWWYITRPWLTPTRDNSRLRFFRTW